MELTPTQALAEYEKIIDNDSTIKDRYNFNQWLSENDITLKE